MSKTFRARLRNNRKQMSVASCVVRDAAIEVEPRELNFSSLSGYFKKYPQLG